MPQDNKTIKKFFNSCWFLLLMTAIFSVFLIMFLRVYYQDYQIKKEIESLKKQAEALEAKKIESLSWLEYFRSEEHMEKTARLEMNLVKPGEQVAIIKEISSTTGSGQAIKDMIKLNLPNYKKWWNYFFNHN